MLLLFIILLGCSCTAFGLTAIHFDKTHASKGVVIVGVSVWQSTNNLSLKAYSKLLKNHSKSHTIWQGSLGSVQDFPHGIDHQKKADSVESQRQHGASNKYPYQLSNHIFLRSSASKDLTNFLLCGNLILKAIVPKRVGELVKKIEKDEGWKWRKKEDFGVIVMDFAN